MKLYPSLLHASHAQNNEEQPMVAMNTTPLIDVMLVLLVMLIITIPMQLHAVPMDMPSVSRNAQSEPELVRVQIDATGFVRWNGEIITSEATLDQRMREAARSPRQPEIHITPAPNTPYALVVTMIALAQKMGLRQVGVVN